MLHVQRLAGPEELAALAPEWDRLHADLSPRTPFGTPLWNTLWWKHLHEDRPLLRDELFAHAVRDDRGDLVAVAPMVITHRPAIGPIRARMLHFFGADKNLTELRGTVCRAGDEAGVIGALNGYFLSNESRWDWLQWSGIRGGDAAFRALSADHAVTWSPEIPEYWLPLPRTWDEFRATLSRNIKESLRKCYNSLKRDGHTFVFRVVDRPEDTPAALARFFELHSARASTRDGIVHADVFAAPRHREFLLAYAQRMAERGSLRVFQLEIGGAVVATRVGFLLGDELYLYFSGYDDAWGRYSVMTTVVAECIKWAIEQRLKLVNLSFGNDVSKTRWSPTSTVFHYGLQVSPTWRGSLAFRAYNEVLRQSQPGAPLSNLMALARRRA